jgi:hypothetical protein
MVDKGDNLALHQRLKAFGSTALGTRTISTINKIGPSGEFKPSDLLLCFAARHHICIMGRQAVACPTAAVETRKYRNFRSSLWAAPVPSVGTNPL